MPEVAVIGTGAVGTAAATAAEQAGADVVICARSAAGGPVTLELDGEERPVAAPVITDADAARPVDGVLLATKAQQTPQARPWLARQCRPGTVVVVLQNGVDHVERVAPLADGASVLPALVYVAVERVDRGRVVHRRGRRVVVPAGPPGRAFAGLLDGSWLEIAEDPDFCRCRQLLFRRHRAGTLAGAIADAKRRVQPLFGCIAQRLERPPYKREVGGSNPPAPTGSVTVAPDTSVA